MSLNLPPEKVFLQHDASPGRDILYNPCRRVSVEGINGEGIQNIIKEMKEKMTGAGIGLAANQIGYPQQIFMMHCPNSGNGWKEVPYQVFINPRITKASQSRIFYWHGCLSAVGHDYGRVATYEWIEIEAYNEKGEEVSERMDEMGSIIFQHEFRHLLGSIYKDKAHQFITKSQVEEKKKGSLLTGPAAPDDPLLLDDYTVGDSIEQYETQKKERLVYKVIESSQLELLDKDWGGSGIDLRDGFIHLCYRDQVSWIVDKFYSDKSDVYIVAIDPALLLTPVKKEQNGGKGEYFPHLYSKILSKSVVVKTKFTNWHL